MSKIGSVLGKMSDKDMEDMETEPDTENASDEEDDSAKAEVAAMRLFMKGDSAEAKAKALKSFLKACGAY